MNLTSMLNSTSSGTDLEEDAISNYRRFSTDTTSASPAPSPRTKSAQDTFRTPSLPHSSSDPDAVSTFTHKRKLDQAELPSSQEKADGNPQKKQDMTSKGKGQNVESSSSHPGLNHDATVPVPMLPIKTRLDIAYDGHRSQNELTSLVKEAISYYLTQDPRTYGKRGIEIEAKIGLITDRNTGQRLHEIFPIHSTTLLHHGYENFRFESNMTEEQHAKFNKHLNDQVELRNPKHPGFNPANPLIRYAHTKSTDSLYAPYRDPNGREVKPRVTVNDKDGVVLETISKENITNIHILCPRMPFDIRLSINLEHPVSAPVGKSPVHERKKDRLAYNLPLYRIDLTKVGSQSNQRYELEVELLNMESIKKMAEADYDGKPSGFAELIEGFMGSIFLLNRTAAMNFPQSGA